LTYRHCDDGEYAKRITSKTRPVTSRQWASFDFTLLKSITAAARVVRPRSDVKSGDVREFSLGTRRAYE
jgi:uncharacterized Zn finger protein